MMPIINSTITKIGVRYVALFPETIKQQHLSDYPNIQFYQHDIIPVRNWCDENIGHYDWYMKLYTWYFTDNEKAILFKLAWK